MAAATLIREHRVKNLPVVKSPANRQLDGCLRTRRLMAYVLNQVSQSTPRQLAPTKA